MPAPHDPFEDPEFEGQEWIDPPPDVLKRVLKSFKRHQSRLQDRLVSTASLTFDSWSRMAPSGVRGALQERQTLFSLDDLDIDVQILKEEEEGLFTVHGQVLPRDGDVAALEGTEVQLLAGGDVYRRVLLDEMGYFRLTLVPAGTYAMRILLETRDVVVEPLDVQAFPAEGSA
ncbi:MAG: hypothetical protein D6802_11970 [Ardenticatenia bacterium]|nr:MAG: hypothetical protein D6802_11970 [Ardenticatenia bacterium]